MPASTRSPEIVQITTGLRPFRPAGHRVTREALSDGRPLVHHYGHGGAGITLSWGTAERAVTLVRETSARHAAVLGAGVVGLSTAVLLREAGLAVTIYTRELPLQTTSAVAGALWAPVSLLADEYCVDAIGRDLAALCQRARQRFDALDRARYGIRDLPLWIVGAGEMAWEMAVAGGFEGTPANPAEVGIVADAALRVDGALLIDPTIYLPALLDDLRGAGAELRLQPFASMDDVLELEADVVVNCTGLGARALCGDDTLVPIKGQLVHLDADPDIDFMLIDEASGCYMFPRPTSIVLGGSFVEGDWSLDPDPAVTARILERNLALLPRLARQPARP